MTRVFYHERPMFSNILSSKIVDSMLYTSKKKLSCLCEAFLFRARKFFRSIDHTNFAFFLLPLIQVRQPPILSTVDDISFNENHQ